MTFRQVHRWISLTVAAIWLVQAITGTLSVFRWEIDDWTVAGAHVPAAWHWSDAVHVTGFEPAQLPATHWSV